MNIKFHCGLTQSDLLTRKCVCPLVELELPLVLCFCPQVCLSRTEGSAPALHSSELEPGSLAHSQAPLPNGKAWLYVFVVIVVDFYHEKAFLTESLSS